jgi:hypothetical protein
MWGRGFPYRRLKISLPYFQDEETQARHPSDEGEATKLSRDFKGGGRSLGGGSTSARIYGSQPVERLPFH